MTLIGEIGTDLSKWKTPAQFASWLCLCPGNHKSGGVEHSGRTRKSTNRLAQAFRNAANTLHRSDTPLGQFFRKMKAKLGAAKATTATAHKMARIVHTMVTKVVEYDPELVKNKDKRQNKRRIKNLEKMAKAAGYQLVPEMTA